MRRHSVWGFVGLAALGALALSMAPAVAQEPAPEPSPCGRYFFVFDTVPGPAEIALVRGAGGTVRHAFTLVPAVSATVPQAALAGLVHHPRIRRLEPVLPCTASDAELDLAWGVQHIGAGTVHAGTPGAGVPGNTGVGVKVAVLDSGICTTHAELAAAYRGGHDFVNGDADPSDDHGHGTHVSGTIAAADDDQGVVGVAPGVELYALKVLDASGSGNFDDVVAALEWCVTNGIQVTNNSYGSSQDPGTTVRDAFAAAEAAGLSCIAAAGNSGNPKGKGDTVGYPATYPSVIAVAATDAADARASFSSSGPDVELAAPGVNIPSTTMDGGVQAAGSGWNGTSMACPHAVGVAALALAAGVLDANGNGRVNDELRALLQSTATDLGDPGRDTHFGFGLVNAPAAATPSNFAPTVQITTPNPGASFGNGVAITFAGTAGDAEDGDVTASLVWSSDVDGVIGTGATFQTATLTADAVHVITAVAQDTGGKTGQASLTITVGSPNTPPVVTITAPAAGATFTAGATITFTGSATDAQDGDLTAGLTWVSDRDGAIGTGGGFTVVLSTGVHQITASVTDGAGAVGQAQVTITVGATPLVVAVWTDQPAYANRDTVRITVDVSDGAAPVAGAAVHVEIRTPGGTVFSGDGTSDAAGQARFTLRVNTKRDGTGTNTVDASATATGYLAGAGSTTYVTQ